MRKNGFTLVELLAVIVLLAILMVIAIPNAFKLAGNVKNQAYNTKIELIEKAAQEFGQSNLPLVRQGTSLTNSSQHTTCTFNFNNKKDIESVSVALKNYSESATLLNQEKRKEYWCTRVSLSDLVKYNNLSWDEENKCNGSKCPSGQEVYYNNVIVNPNSNYIMNNCVVYVYYRNNRVYAYFDKNECDNKKETPNSNNFNEYRPLNG